MILVTGDAHIYIDHPASGADGNAERALVGRCWSRRQAGLWSADHQANRCPSRTWTSTGSKPNDGSQAIRIAPAPNASAKSRPRTQRRFARRHTSRSRTIALRACPAGVGIQPGNACALVQAHGERADCSTKRQTAHIPAFREMIRFSINIMRGLFRRLHLLFDHRARGAHHPEPPEASCARSKRSATARRASRGISPTLAGRPPTCTGWPARIPRSNILPAPVLRLSRNLREPRHRPFDPLIELYRKAREIPG